MIWTKSWFFVYFLIILLILIILIHNCLSEKYSILDFKNIFISESIIYNQKYQIYKYVIKIIFNFYLLRLQYYVGRTVKRQHDILCHKNLITTGCLIWFFRIRHGFTLFNTVRLFFVFNLFFQKYSHLNSCTSFS